MRLYNEILEKKYFWKKLIKDCKQNVQKYVVCLKHRGGKKLLFLLNLFSKRAKERYVVDERKLHPYWQKNQAILDVLI
jgi:hypothetical protein